MILDILTYPHKNLRLKSLSVDQDEILSIQFQTFLKNLGETMLKKDGAGLASPQVNIQKRAVAINQDNSNKIKFYINPKITKKSLFKKSMEEGCLSIPGIFDVVRRPKTITVKYQDQYGIWQIEKCNLYTSRVLQHEIDHLDGVLFIDKIIKKHKN